jgi:hypothetical protein
MLTNLVASEAFILFAVRDINRRLAELDIAQGYVTGTDPNVGVAELSGAAGHASRPVRED